MCKGLEMSQFDDESQGSWKEPISDELPDSPMWWSWNESLALISNLVKCHHLWRVLKWVNEHQFPDFLWIVSRCWVWRVLKWVNEHQFPDFLWIVSHCWVWRVLKWVNVDTFTGFCFWSVLKGVSLCCYTACCLDSSGPIHFIWWYTVVHVASQPLPWLHGGCYLGSHGELSSAGLHGDLSSVHGGLPGLLGSHGLHGGLSSSVLHGDLSSVHGGLPGLLGSHGLHGGLSSSVLHGDLSSVHGGLPGLLGVSWAVCPPVTWLCIVGVGSLWSCTSCLLWVLFPVYGWFLVWNET